MVNNLLSTFMSLQDMINLKVVCKSYFDQCQELYSNYCCVLNMHTFITEMLESVYKNMKSLLHYGD